MCIYHTSFILTLIQKRKSCIKMTIVLRHLRPYNGSHIVSVPVSVYFLRLFRCCRFFPPIFFFSVSIFRWTCSCVFMFVYQHRVIIFSSKLFFFSAVDWARFCAFCVSSVSCRGNFPAPSHLSFAFSVGDYLFAIHVVPFLRPTTHSNRFTSFYYFPCACRK